MSQDSNRALRDRLAERPIIPLPIPTTNADKPLTTRACILCGWSLRETTGGATATVEFEAAQGTQGPPVGEQQMASGGTGSQVLPDEGVLCEGGVFLHVTSGSVTGCIWVRL